MWQGEAVAVKMFPFAMWEWERKRVERYWPTFHLSADSASAADGEPVHKWRDISGGVDNWAAMVLTPLWFRVWLKLRTFIAQLK